MQTLEGSLNEGYYRNCLHSSPHQRLFSPPRVKPSFKQIHHSVKPSFKQTYYHTIYKNECKESEHIPCECVEENNEPGFPEQPRVPRLAELLGLPGLAEPPRHLEITSIEIPGLTDNSESESEDECDIRQFYQQHQLYDALKESIYDLFL